MKQLTELGKRITTSKIVDLLGLAFIVGALYGVLLAWIAWRLP